MLLNHSHVVIAIRTHTYGNSEENLYKYLVDYFGINSVYFIFDATVNKNLPNLEHSFKFAILDLENMNLYHKAPKIGWRCGDYFYYVLREEIKADYYWLIEPDVKLTFSNPKDFFCAFENDNSDLIAPDFGPRGPAWMWSKCISDYVTEVYGCAFPLTRLSGVAIDKLYQSRVQQSSQFLNSGKVSSDWSNDESFVSSTCKELGLSCLNMKKILPNAFLNFSTRNPYLWDTAQYLIPKDQIVHPALEGVAFDDALLRKVIATLNNSTLTGLLQTALLGNDQEDRVRASFNLALSHYFNLIKKSHNTQNIPD